MNKFPRTIFAFLFSLALMAQEAPKEEKKLNLSVGGRFYMDGAVYFKDETPLSNGVGMSDLRIGLKAKYGKWDGKIDVGFANSKVSMKDVFAQYNFAGNSYMRAGHYAEPFGIDYMESSSNIKFITAGATTQAFAPGRKLGVEYIGWTKNLWFAGGVFSDKDINNSTKGNDGYAFTGRMVFNPLQDPGKILHIGAAGSYRRADANGFDADGEDNPRNINYASNAETYIESTKFISATIDDAKNQVKYALELIGGIGPVNFQGEFFQSFVNRENDLKRYDAKGAYGQIGVLALGGDYTYSAAWARTASPKAGALEFVVRYNWTDLNNDKSAIYGGKMNDISVAANYYLNKYIV